MDLPGEDEKEYGVDALTVFSCPYIDILQSCVVESKRYSINSLSASKLNEWINRLREKIDAFTNSHDLIEKFPSLEEASNINLGIIMCWVNDAPDELYFKSKFNAYLESVNIKTLANKRSTKRILVLTNPRILRLCSIAEIISSKDFNYRFIYPSQLLEGKPLVRSKVLSVEYLMSDFIFAERQDKNHDLQTVVFYLSDINYKGFKCLYESLIMYNLLEKNKKIIIYYYGAHIENREILIDAKRIFKDLSVEFLPLNVLHFTIEPSILFNANE